MRFQFINSKFAVPLIAALGVLAAMPAVGRADGKIVVGNDDWTLSNTGYSNAASTGQFALNVASFFGATSGSNLLAYSGNFGLTQSNLASTMTGAGYNWTVSTSAPFTLANLENYKAIFLGGTAVPSTAILTQYVQAGGDVYLYGGSAGLGAGTSAAEAAAWNPFLNAFGLTMIGPSYNGVTGLIPTPPSPSDSLFNGISSLYYNNSNDVAVTNPGNPQTYVDLTSGGHSLVAVYNGASSAPEPGALPLAALGALPLAGFLRSARRRKPA